MSRTFSFAVLALCISTAPLSAQPEKVRYLDPINITPPHVTADASVKYDFSKGKRFTIFLSK